MYKEIVSEENELNSSSNTITYDEFKKLVAFYYKHSNPDSIHAKLDDLLDEYFNVKDNYESVDAYIQEQISNPDW